ncbi:MAG: YlmH/Sll1252 family protein [Eubacterium sp.]
MDNEELLKKRLYELSHRAYERGYKTFSEFLNLNEISTLKSLKLESNNLLFGGYLNAERCVSGFGDNLNECDFPIVCIKIEPLNQKFADRLTHRDFLGSLMNLGINRNNLGDIIISDNIGYLFCLNSMSDYIIKNLCRIRHTTVTCSIIDYIPDFITKEPEGEEIIISSQRADVIVSAVFKMSRNQVTQLFNQEKVFINSKVAYKESLMLNEDDIISVRGYGKFIFSKALRETKKGRTVAEVKIYR